MENIFDSEMLRFDNLGGFILKIVFSLVVFIISVLLTKAISKLIVKASKDKVDDTAVSILRSIVKYAILIICVIMILNIFGVNSTSLLAVLGSAGLAVGLALKNTLGNIASGIILIFLKNYRAGEFIEFGATSGTVKSISLFTTILETQEGIYVSAPNSCIWGVPLRNYSRNGKRRMELNIRVSCSYSLDTAVQIIKNLTDSDKRLLQVPAAQIVIQSVQDKNASFIIRAWVLNNDYWDVYYSLLRAVKEKLEEAGILI